MYKFKVLKIVMQFLSNKTYHKIIQKWKPKDLRKTTNNKVVFISKIQINSIKITKWTGISLTNKINNKIRINKWIPWEIYIILLQTKIKLILLQIILIIMVLQV